MTDPEKIRLIAMDLDGTLTKNKTPITKKNFRVLESLSKKYRLLMAGAGMCRRIFTQLREFPIDILGNYGMQASVFDAESNDIDVLYTKTVDVLPREEVLRRAEKIRERFGFRAFLGDSCEFHESGVISFALLGTKADPNEKLKFDPERKIRRAMLQEVIDSFPEYNVCISGSSSFDFIPKPYDKAYALRQHIEENGYSAEEVCYIGDDYGYGGNDEPVYLSEFQFITINDYQQFSVAVKPLLDK